MLRKFLFLKIVWPFVGGWIKDAIGGKHGAFLGAVGGFLIRHSVNVGVLLAATCAALFELGQPSAAQSAGAVAALLLPIGFIGSAWRTVPASVTEAAWYKFFRSWWPDLVTVGGAAAIKLHTCLPDLAAVLARFHLSCAIGLGILTALGAIGGWLFGEAKLDTAPDGQGLRLQVLQSPPAG